MIMFVAVAPASAQSRYRDRWRDNGLSTKEKVAVIGGGAAAGAIIGGLLGGKKGAIIGGVLGGGAGTGYVIVKEKTDDDDRWERPYRGRYENRRYDNRRFIRRVPRR
jgi:hypothetical protein